MHTYLTLSQGLVFSNQHSIGDTYYAESKRLRGRMWTRLAINQGGGVLRLGACAGGGFRKTPFQNNENEGPCMCGREGERERERASGRPSSSSPSSFFCLPTALLSSSSSRIGRLPGNCRARITVSSKNFHFLLVPISSLCSFLFSSLRITVIGNGRKRKR